jgi:hypothetical protein
MNFLNHSLSKIQKFVFLIFFLNQNFVVVILDRKIVFVPLFVLEASLFVVPMILSFIKCCFDDYLFDRSRWNESTLGISYYSMISL